MSTRVQSRRSVKRRTVQGACSRGKMVLDVDLNDYPDDIPSSSWFPLETSDTAVSLASQAVSTRRGANREGTAPIDVDAIDDEVVFVSASTGINQSSNQYEGTTTPVMVVLDEDSDAHQISSGVAVGDPITISSKRFKRRKRNLPGGDIINCDSYEILDSNSEKHANQKEVVRGSSERKVAARKEPTFSCAVCLGRLVNETSTTCGHIFCEDCIKTAIKSQKKCPTCRTSLTMRKIHRVYLPTS